LAGRLKKKISGKR